MDEQEQRRKVARALTEGTLIKLASNMGVKLLGVVFYILFLRLLTPEEAGYFLIATAVLGISTVFSSFGLHVSLYRFVPYFIGKGQPGRVKPFINLLFKSTMAIAAAFSVLLFVFAPQIADFYGKPISGLLQLTAICSFLSMFSLFIVSVLDSLKFFMDGAVATVVSTLAKVVFLLIAVYIFFSRSAYAALVATALSLLVFCIHLLLLSWKKYSGLPNGKERSKEESKADLWEAAKFGFPVYLSAMAESTAAWFDALVIGFFWASPVVAAYSSVMVFARNIPPLVSSAVNNVQQTLLSEHHGKNSRMFDMIVHLGSKWTVYLGLPVLAVFLAFPTQIIGLLFPKYVSSAYLFYVVAPAFFLVLLSNSSRNALFAIGRSDLLFKIAMVLTLLNIAFNLALVPQFGIDGAGVATMLSISIGETLAIYYASKYAKTNITLRGLFSQAWKGAFSAVLAIVLCLLLLQQFASQGLVQLAISCAAMCVFYGVSLLLLGSVNREEWKISVQIISALPFGEFPASLVEKIFIGEAGKG